MKFIIARHELAEIVNRVQNIIAAKSPIPILSNFLIEAKDNRIIVTATDLTVGVRVQHPAKVLEEGATTMPARRFGNLIKELTSSHVEVSVDSRDMVHVSADASNFKLPGLSRNEYPTLPDIKDGAELRMKQKDLKEMLFCTSFAVARDDSRYILTGLSVQVANSVAVFTGTDGKRLSRAYQAVVADSAFQCDIVIPLKAIDEIVKGLTRDDEEAILTIMPDKIALEAGDMLIVSKLISGDYPNVDKVIPKEVKSSVQLHREELMSLLRQMQLFIPDTTHSVRFTFGSGELHLSVNTTDIGEGKVNMPVNYSGDRFDIAFNPTFFLDILRHTKEETVRLQFSDPYNPGLITDGEKQDTSTLFVLMPMRLNEAVS